MRSNLFFGSIGFCDDTVITAVSLIEIHGHRVCVRGNKARAGNPSLHHSVREITHRKDVINLVSNSPSQAINQLQRKEHKIMSKIRIQKTKSAILIRQVSPTCYIMLTILAVFVTSSSLAFRKRSRSDSG